MDQRIVLTSKFYSFGNIFCDSIATIDSDSPYGTGKNELKIFFKVFTISDIIKTLTIHIENQNINIKRSLEGVDYKLHG